MDLVSSTLDRYLKHRFNGNLNDSGNKTKKNTPTDNGVQVQQETTSSNVATTTLTSTTETSDSHHSIDIQGISFNQIMPCCVALRKDLSYIAAGFENSHIYLWELSETAHEQQQPSNSNSTIITHNQASINPVVMHKLLAHSGAIYSIQFIQSNDLMLSCSEDTTIRLWCLNTKCNLFIYRGHSYPIWCLVTAPHGDYFASGSMDSTARLWQVDKMFPLRIFCGHENDVECLQFHPNTKYLATGSSDNTVRLWNISDGRMVRLMVGHQRSVISLSFLPNGKFLASASEDGAIKIWNLATNCVTEDRSVPASHTISFSPEQDFISTCGSERVFRLWQVDKSNVIERKRLDLSDRYKKIIQSYFLGDRRIFIFGYSNDP